MTLRELTLPGQPRTSRIQTENGILQRAGELLTPASRCLVITDSNVAPLYADSLRQSLACTGNEVLTHEIPSGEASKSLATAETIYQVLQQHQLNRNDYLIALGGGVVGDIAGFCASTWHRGMRLVQIPTTLVAQVDSSIGGKTALNLPTVKNAVGTFYQPELVIIDPQVLSSLPEREIRAGLGEIVKYSLIETSCTGEEAFFGFLESHPAPDHWQAIIARCCAIKATVVEKDEYDRLGLRALLNLGHTFGHAYETVAGYEAYRHGEAVALGLAKACKLAVRLGQFPVEDRNRVEALLKKLGLPVTDHADCPLDQLIQQMRRDKKATVNEIRLILPHEAIGKAQVLSVSELDLRAVL